MTRSSTSSDVASARVVIIIVNYKTAALTTACLQSLAAERCTDESFRVVVVDNQSGDGDCLARTLEDRGWSSWVSLLVAEKNGGFSYGNNRGIEHAVATNAHPEYLLLLNPDTEVRGGAVQALVDFMDKHPKVGIAGSSFENPDGTDWPIAFRFFSIASEFERGMRLGFVSRLLRRHIAARDMKGCEGQVDWVAGASMMVRREVFESVGLLDEGFFLYYEEVDFCLRARRCGWPCWYVPSSRVMHISGQSTGVSSKGVKTRPMPRYWFESRTRYFVKNHGLWYARLADAVYGIGLTLYKLRAWICRRPDSDPPGLLLDFLRHSVVFRSGRAVRDRIFRS